MGDERLSDLIGCFKPEGRREDRYEGAPALFK
jgi:hypothetical protein